MKKNIIITRKPFDKYDLCERFAVQQAQSYLTVGACSVEDREFGGERLKAFWSYRAPLAIMSENGLKVWVVNKNYSAMTSQHLQAIRGALWRAGFEQTDKAVWTEDLCQSRYYRSSGKVEYTEYKRTAKKRKEALEKYLTDFAKKRDELNARSRATAKERRGGPPPPLYKVLSIMGAAIHGGHFVYDLPRFVDGAWIPGEWTEEVNVSICSTGYHVTTRPSKWGAHESHNRVFEVEVRGRCQREGDKRAYRSIRLIRELTRKEVEEVINNEHLTRL